MPFCHRPPDEAKPAAAGAQRFDRAQFAKPIAHRGLHDIGAGVVENSGPAFAAALAAGHGIECDLRPAAGGLPLVFHDDTLERLIDGHGAVDRLTAGDLKRLRYTAAADTPILSFAELLDLVAGRQPLLVEIKSEWAPVDRTFMARIADLARSYKGPLALMSFDPAVMVAMRELAPDVPRGLVSGLYRSEPDDDWWRDKLAPGRAFALSHLLEAGPVAPDFVAYHVKALPTPVLRYVREVQGLPVFTWTVRSAEDADIAARWADAPIFEGAVARRHYAAKQA